MIEFTYENNKGQLRTSGNNADILNELLSVNFSVIKSLTNDKQGFDNLKDQMVMLMVNEKLASNYYYDSYEQETEE